MPASLPGSTRAENLANPSAGKFVIFDPLSGPKGSPLDAKIATGTYDANRVPIKTADPTNLSTGALSTGIGIGPSNRAIAAGRIFESGFDDNFIPGTRQTYAAPPPRGVATANTVDSTRMYIGGGRMIAGTTQDKVTGKPWIPSPYTAGVALVGAGNGASRDAGAGPAFTGFEMKMVTAAATVANGAVVETGYANRTGVSLAAGESTFGSASAASAAPLATGPSERGEPQHTAERDPNLPRDQPRGYPDDPLVSSNWHNEGVDEKDRLPGGGTVLIIESEEDKSSVDEQRERARRDDAEKLEELKRIQHIEREEPRNRQPSDEGQREDPDKLPGGGKVLIIHSEEDAGSVDEQRERAKREDAKEVERSKREEDERRRRDDEAREIFDRERRDAVERGQRGDFRAGDRGRDDGPVREEDRQMRDKGRQMRDAERTPPLEHNVATTETRGTTGSRAGG